VVLGCIDNYVGLLCAESGKEILSQCKKNYAGCVVRNHKETSNDSGRNGVRKAEAFCQWYRGVNANEDISRHKV
jgi:hypothetical protein